MTERIEFKMKVALLGASGVGKTSILHRYAYNNYTKDKEQTIGASFATKKVKIDESKYVQLNIWDTAGQERFESIMPMYYRDADIIIIVYDIRDLRSFTRAKKWVGTIKEEVTNDNNHPNMNPKIMFVGNKIDDEMSRVVKKDDVNDFCQSITDLNIETSYASAKTGKNVMNIFEKAAIEQYEIKKKFIEENKRDDSDLVDINKPQSSWLEYLPCLGFGRKYD